ncbi:MAG: chromosomal replication initiator protein DnaA [Alphaproteobacteria bacterium]|nr:chromosomal replication initiator protein DnaA [Alphaproteobacteria bacterium]
MNDYWGSGDSAILEQWQRVRARLRADVGDAAFNSWLKPLTLAEVIGGRVRVAVPTRLMRDWIETNYADRLAELWRDEDTHIEAVEVIVEPTPTAIRPAGAPPLVTRPTRTLPLRTSEVSRSANDEAPGRQAVLEAVDRLQATLDPRFKFNSFVVGRSNELAHAAARRVAEAPKVPFNPLFLYGSVGLGKTHLMHAIAWHILERAPGRTVLYLSAEKFMYQFIRALRYKTIMDFKEQFRSVDVLMIDDIQFIAGKDSTQEEFFHTFNALVDENRQVVVSADKLPSGLDGMDERLKSRLGCGLVADIHQTDYELRLGILQAKGETSDVGIPPKVLEFLAHKITSNVRELEGALNRILAHATLVGRPVTLETTQEVLHDLLRANDRRVTIEEIQKRVAEHFNIRLADMHSARRARAVARPRQVAMYLAKQLTSRSLPEIGRKFGGRDHTTVMHAVRKIEELRSTDASFSEDVELLRRMLEM